MGVSSNKLDVHCQSSMKGQNVCHPCRQQVRHQVDLLLCCGHRIYYLHPHPWKQVKPQDSHGIAGLLAL
jgi:hypothetical protein